MVSHLVLTDVTALSSDCGDIIILCVTLWWAGFQLLIPEASLGFVSVCVFVHLHPHRSDQSSGRWLVQGQIRFLRRERFMVERAVHRPAMQRLSVESG